MTEDQRKAFLALYTKNRKDKAEKYLKVTEADEKLLERNARSYARTHKAKVSKIEMPRRADGRPLTPLGWRLHTALTGMTPEDYRKLQKSYTS